MGGVLKGLAVMAFGIWIIYYGRSDIEIPLPVYRFTNEKSRRILCTVFGSIIVFVGFIGIFILD